MSIAITYPFTLNTVGQVATTDNFNKIYMDRVLTLLSTNIGQRPMYQTYGTDLNKALFENDNDLSIAVQSAINEAISIWIPEISVESIEVGSPDLDGASSVTVSLRFPDNTASSLYLNTATFSYDGTITR